jgi:hypothetical protein
MSKAARAKKKAGRAGRPKKAGERYACGKLKPPGPNARIIAERRRLLGGDSLDLSMASNPLDLAFARGWLSVRRYRAARALMTIRRRAGLKSPGWVLSRMPEALTSEIGRPGEGAVANGPLGLTRGELVAAWDGAFNRPAAEDQEAAATWATAQWRAIYRDLTPDERREVDRICVEGEWPGWIVETVIDPDADVYVGWKRRKRMFEAGLDKVSAVLWPRTAPAPGVTATAARPRLTLSAGSPTAAGGGEKVEEALRFVDETGEVQMTSARGRPFEVVRLVRRGRG